MKEMYKLKTRPWCSPENTVEGKNYRLTVLTDSLLRLEYSRTGEFEDRATQTVLNRDFPKVSYTVKETEDQLELFTEHLHLFYNKKEFSSFGLSIRVLGNVSNYNSVWHFGEETDDLGGTARTLDNVNGACPLEHGLMSRSGFSVLDDAQTLVLTDDGWVEPRKKGNQDLYFFGYGHEYRRCLRDFYYLCGKTPMLPRYALGNWWSRYYEYTEDSYRALMERFDEENLPFTVAVVDMDWHLVDIDPKYGSGWTGYTWNREIFPDPKRFMDWLHGRGMKITLNVHPADGVRAHEEMYPQMAKAMGIDPATEQPVNFDFTDPAFVEAYFSILHHPNEEQGVDFWWLDWQQGQNTKVEGLDPLWMLNHFHYLDSGRDGKRPMTFSRYAGPGSHRYPAGFSGDTHMTWASLDFQPYFTATASNIGFGWWSHDIGGHMLGIKDDEMIGRWVQFGVFSPLMRLHSTKDEFNGKEPWRFKEEVRRMMGNFLRLRHQMMPYLYTMNYRAYRDDLPIVEPMYYEYPEEPAAYEMKNQYFFGTELIAAPITTPRIRGLNVAKVNVWLPEGIWFDLFTGVTYRGGRRLELYRGIDTIPVFAKAGAILPFTPEISGIAAGSNPKELTLRVYGGADGSFAMYEDGNDTRDYENESTEKYVTTQFTLNWNDEDAQSIVIRPAAGDCSLIPERRTYTVELYGCGIAPEENPDAASPFPDGEEYGCGIMPEENPDAVSPFPDEEEKAAGATYLPADREEKAEDVVQVFTDGEKREDFTVSYDAALRCMKISLPETKVNEKIEIIFKKKLQLAPNRVRENLFAFLNQAEIEFGIKSRIYNLIKENRRLEAVISELRVMGIDSELMGCVLEILTAF